MCLKLVFGEGARSSGVGVVGRESRILWSWCCGEGEYDPLELVLWGGRARSSGVGVVVMSDVCLFQSSIAFSCVDDSAEPQLQVQF